MADTPSRDDLLAVAAFADQFEDPHFIPGEWIHPAAGDDGVIQIGWWSASDAVFAWEAALYDRRIINPDCDYLSARNVRFVNRAIAMPSLLADVDLSTLRSVLTFLARAERHSGGGWYESAFESGLAQVATRRLGELARTVA